MSVPGSASPLFLATAASAAAAAHQVDRSLRFNSGDSAYLNRTPSSAGSRKTWTWSGWVKRSKLGAIQYFFASVPSGSAFCQFGFNSDDTLRVQFRDSSANANSTTNAVFRDVSAWYHIVFYLDTTQSTASNRMKTWVNGVEQTFSTDARSSITQNGDYEINNTSQHVISSQRPYDTAGHFDGYLAEVQFVDGQALAATDFGKYDSNNVWQPKAFTGSYSQSSGGRTIANSSGAIPILNTSDADGQTVSSGVRSDSNSSSIVLAVPLNGSNGGTTITDYHHTIKGSGSAKTVSIYTGSASGGAVTSTAVSRYYGSSFYVVRGATNNYTASDYIYRTGDSDLSFGTGSFCVEFWYYPTGLQSNCGIFDNRHPSTDWPNDDNGFALITTGNGSIFSYSNGNQVINHSSKLTVNQWHHIAYTRDGSTERLFVDGDFFSTTASSSRDYNRDRFYLGTTANNGEGSDGYYADLRIYKGTAKYTSNFNVPVLGVGGVNSFYLKFADNSSNAALGTDSSGLSNTWTVNGLLAVAPDELVIGSSEVSTSGTVAGALNIFDGDISTAVSSSDGSRVYWTPASNISVSKFEVYFTSQYSGYKIGIEVTGGSSQTITKDTSTNSPGWVEFTSISGDTIGPSNRVMFRSYRSNDTDPGILGISALRVNDEIVVTSSGVAGIDSMIDTPTNYTAESGNNGGNYCTLNPLDRQSTNGTLSNGNLDITQSSAAWAMYRSTMFVSSGKWYWECTIGNNQYSTIGIVSDEYSMGQYTNAWVNQTTDMFGYYPYNGNKYNGSSGVSYATADTSASGSVIGVALDMDNGTLAFYKDGTSLGTAYTGLTGKNVSPTHWLYNQSNADSYNFGQRPFKYTNAGSDRPAATYLSLCTTNLPDPTIADGSTVFDVDIWSGDNSDPRSRTLFFGPDLVWIKTRNQTNWHYLTDSVRGAPNKLYTNSTNAEDTSPIYGQIDSLNSDGFTLGGGTDSSNPLSDSNQSGTNYVAWAWDAGTSTVSNTDGSVTSNVRASQANGCSVVTWTGSSAGQTVGHGLGAAPEWIIVKARNQTQPWVVYHSALGKGGVLQLHDTAANITTYSQYWGTAEPSSTVFGTYTGAYPWANNYGNMVAYCFAPVEGFSAFGSYEGTGSASTAAFVHTGMRPRWIMFKNIDTGDSSADWVIYDTARTSFNSVDDALFPNRNAAEANETSHAFDILSNGFKVRSTSTSGLSNKSGNTYIYAAFAEHPFKTARAR